MVLLPELLLRWSLGERRLEVPAEWSRTPERVPVGDERAVNWSRAWFDGVAPSAAAPRPSLKSRMLSLFPDAVQRKVRRARQERRDQGLPVGYRDLDWQPACWYADRWPAMRAFALPSFYDGRVRVNLRGREAAGTVAPADYERVLDEIEALARECVDPITGASVVESVERPAGGDPFALDRSLSDLVIVWAGCPLAFHHPHHGAMGPVPYRRTGGHTGPYGFASITGPDLAPGAHGIGAALDVAPTVYELVAGRPAEHLSGTSRVRALTLTS
jgi:hypothetical protein